MRKKENMDVIENQLSGKDFRIAGITNDNGYQLSKIYLADEGDVMRQWIGQFFPTAEIVQNMHEITKDNCIELVIVSANRLNDPAVLANIMQTGKHVRIV